MNISFLHPVFELLREIGCAETEMAQQLHVKVTDISDGTVQVLANVVYRFLDWAAERADDRYFP